MHRLFHIGEKHDSVHKQTWLTRMRCTFGSQGVSVFFVAEVILSFRHSSGLFITLADEVFYTLLSV